ncbi:hypothetical protein [Pedobacter deserti]|uniref:hypothetical protein n=1 Tax=Pedobacter deserti TaxID=2817382 RepID=UPI00210D37EB|nr:hypothetical protein [Pedobacter sp. SYSU D00382]
MNQYKAHIILIFNAICVIILIITSQSACGQIFSEEQNPLSVKWRQIQSPGFRIIYPDELEHEAQRMANTMSHIYPYVGSSLSRHKTSIPVVLQNRGVTANGFVQLAPKKSEFYTTPPQQFDSQDWLNNLAVHELRHVAQFDKLTGGKASPFPEEIYFAWFGASIPLWFFEGDAVSIETALTRAGRGKIPSWIMPYRAALLEGKRLSYSKAYFGSDKDLTPGYYQLGYLLSSHIRSKHGGGVSDSILTDIRKRPLRPYPFSGSLKKYTGMGTRHWYLQTQSDLQGSWSDQNNRTESKNYEILNQPASFATNYFMPVRLADQRILALKQSKAQASHFVVIDSARRENKLLGIGPQEQPWFSYANGLVVWDEIREDPRFKQRSYSVICSYNMNSGIRRTLTRRSRLFSPSLSADASRIVAVQIDLSNKCNLVELDASTGKILNTISNPDNHILQTPAYDHDDSSIAVVRVSEAGKQLAITDGEGNMRVLIDSSRQQINRPVFIGNGIAFNAHYNGIDNIYYIDTTSKKISALSASKYGAFNISLQYENSDAPKILFNDFGATGYHVAETRLTHLNTGKNNFVSFGAAAKAQEGNVDVFSNIPDSSYQSTRYHSHSLHNLFKFHSLSPVIENEYQGGLQLKSNNLLNTLDVFAGADYHRDLKRFAYYTGFSFKSLYPILRATYRNRPRRTFYNTRNGMQQGDWRENHMQLQASVPLSINAMNHNYSFSFNTSTSYTQRYIGENMPANYIRTLRFPLEYNLSFTHSTRTAPRDIAPAWAQILRVTYAHQPLDDNLAGRIFAAEGFLYFPGIARNHSFLANFNYQTATGIRRYETQINTVFGYNNINARSPLNNTLLFNYRFPFAFPDAEIGPLAYVRNLRAGIFCHYENIGTETSLAEPKTYGFELRSHMHLLRYQPLVDVGARFVFVNKLYDQKPILEFTLSYSL